MRAPDSTAYTWPWLARTLMSSGSKRSPTVTRTGSPGSIGRRPTSG